MILRSTKAGIGLAIVSLVALLVSVGPSEAQTAPTLGKTGTDVLTGSTTTAAPGDTIAWAVDAGNPTSGPVSATISDPIQGAGAAQTYVPGSLKAPPGYTTAWSTDGGATWSGTDPGAAVNAVRASNADVPSPATSAAQPIPRPFQGLQTPTGGDGYVPILYTTAAGTPQVWNIYHHMGGPTGRQIVCTDRTTGTPCPGWTGARHLSTTPGPFGQGPADVVTTSAPMAVEDPGNAALRHVTVRRAGFGMEDLGDLCINLETQATCGYAKLTDNSTSLSFGINASTEAVLSGTSVYTYTAGGEMVCFDTAAHAACPGQPYAMNVSGFGWSVNTAAGGKIFGDSMVGSTVVMWCFDTVTKIACTGWNPAKAIPKVGGGDFVYYGFRFFTYDASGAATGVCAGLSSKVQDSQPSHVLTAGCFDIFGSAMPAPSGMQVFQPAVYGIGQVDVVEALEVMAPNGHPTTYLPFVQSNAGFGNVHAGGTLCYDWVTSSPCAAFPDDFGIDGYAFHATVNRGDTRDYGYAYDGRCMFGLGDAGWLFTVDPITGAAPCLKTQATVAIDPAAFYCDGKPGHVQSYGTVSLEDIDPSTVNFATSKVTVKDADGNVVGTFPFDAATGIADISSVPVRAGGVSVIVDVALLNESSWTSTMQPRAQVTFVGDTPQMCFNTTLSQVCTTAFVSNQATATYTGASGTTTVQSPVVTLNVTGGGSGETSTHGKAYGLDAASLGVHLLNQIGNVSTAQPGSPADAARRIATVGLPGLVSAGVITTGSHSTLTPFPSSTSTATTSNVNLLGGALTADVVQAVSQTSASGESVTYNSAGSTFAGLKINGQPLTNVAPNTTVNVRNPLIPSQIVAAAHLFEDAGTSSFANGVANASHQVNMIRLVLVKPFLTLPAGAEIIVSHAESDVTTPACPQGTRSVSGNAFTAFAKGTLAGQTVVSTKVGEAILPATGGADSDGTSVTLPAVVTSGTASNTTSGSREPNPHSTARSVVQSANVLNGLVTATVLDVASTSSADGTTAGTTFAMTSVDVKVGGLVVNGPVAPNTTIAVPMSGGGLLRVVLNERVVNTNGTSDTEGTIHAIHASVFDGSGVFEGEVIVASAHSDAHV